MKFKDPSRMLAKLALFAGMLVAFAYPSPARAAIILIDPGSSGSQSSRISLDIADFTDLFGDTLVGQRVQLDLRFAGTKFLLPPAGVGFYVVLDVSYDNSSLSGDSATLHETYLSDQAGLEILTPDSTSSTVLGSYNMEISGDYVPATEFFQGVFFDLTLQNSGQSLLGATIVFESGDADAPFTVGVVPEPSIGALVLLASLSAVLLRGRKVAAVKGRHGHCFSKDHP